MISIILLNLAACHDPIDKDLMADRTATLTLGASPVATVDPRFLSFAVDISQVVGGEFWNPSAEGDPETLVEPYDFTRPALRTFTVALAPAWLRIGGTDADHVWYDLGDAPVETPPEPYGYVLDRETWNGVGDFARETGLDVLFTVNAGPGPRDEAGAWTPDQCASLMDATAELEIPVGAWELGNEPNAYLLEHGFSLSPEQYGADVKTLATLRDAVDPDALVVGPAVAYWPVSGEFLPYTADAVAAAGTALDVVTWHYYPQQSDRCPIATRSAELETMLDPSNLDEVATWAAQVEAAPSGIDAPVWLGETGNAQCGGQAGVSDRFASTFWWVDELGSMARRGQQIVVRQTLSGSDYGMLDEDTLQLRPDAWASILWKQVMGTGVLEVGSNDPLLRAWAHVSPSGEGVGLALLNLDLEHSVLVDGWEGTPRVHLLEGSLDATTILHNGSTLSWDGTGDLPELTSQASSDVVLPPGSIAFVILDASGT